MELLALIAACVPTVPPPTLAAIVAHESGGNPYAVGLNSRTHKISSVPKTRAAAVGLFRKFREAGFNSYDIGLAQINSMHLKRFGLTAEALLDPCTNLRIGAQILGECYLRTNALKHRPQQRLAKALSCYNTGNLKNGFTNGYVRSVYRFASSPKPIHIALTPTPHSKLLSSTTTEPFGND